MRIARKLLRIAAPMTATMLGVLVAAHGWSQTAATAKPFVYGSRDLFYVDRMAASFKAGDGLPEDKAERMRAR
jgi:hypothetical protein